MANVGEILTGSTDRPIQDGGVRGILALLLVFALRFIDARLDFMTDSELVEVITYVPSILLVAAGFWDRFTRGRVLDRAASPADAPGSPAP